MKSSSYHFPRFPRRIRLPSQQAIRPLLTLISLLALFSCASQSASQSELSSLRAELRSLQDENSRLARRVERLEAQRIASPAGGSGAVAANPREVPSLMVVKVKPKSDPAPKLSVSVPVVEPDAEVVAEILEALPPGTPRAQSGSRASDPSLDAEFADAVAALRTGNVSGGIARLQKFAAQNPRHPKADNALYFASIGLMAQSDFEGAASVLERLLSSYPATDEAQAAMLKLAECRLRLKNARQAREVYTQVVNKYPGSAAANEATQRLALLPP